MKMCEALALIDELTDSGWYARPRYYNGPKRMKNDTIANQSYRRWALNELREFLSSCPGHEPIFLIEKYRSIMNEKACSGKTESFRYTFTMCYEVATEVLDLLLVR